MLACLITVFHNQGFSYFLKAGDVWNNDTVGKVLPIYYFTGPQQ